MNDFKPRMTTVVLFQGDDLDPIAQRLKDVERIAVSTAKRRIGDAAAVTTAATVYDEFMDGAVARAIKVELCALGRKKYRALRNQHPVRMVASAEDPNKQVPHEDDEPWGFNFETFGDALLLGDRSPEVLAPPSITRVYSDTEGAAPTVETDAQREEFLDRLSDTEFSKLFSEAVMLNEGDLPDPKARLSSLLVQTSGETSESPARLG